MRIIRQDQLPSSVISRELVGDDHGGVGICLAIVDAEPGRGPSLHRHEYDEVLIVLEGQARLLGDDPVEVGAGDIVIVPAGEPHGFVSIGEARLRQIDIHVSPRFGTEWLPDAGAADAD